MSEHTNNLSNNVGMVRNFEKMAAIISVFGINKTIWETFDDYIIAEGCGSLISLSAIVNISGMKERLWEVLEMRAGFAKHHTYDEIGEHWGVGRARAQQLGQRALERLEKNLSQELVLLVQLETIVADLWPYTKYDKDIDKAVIACQLALPTIGWQAVQDNDIRRLLLAIRSLINAKMSEVPEKLPELSYFACSLHPAILKHPTLAAEDAIRNPRWTYELLAGMVLEEAGEALHYRVIAERIEEMNLRAEVSQKVVHSTLIAKDEFALVSPGTYGLTAWGLISVDAYNEIIAEVMKKVEKAMTLNEISFYVNSERPVKPNSLRATLDAHPRFYRTAEGTYGLRSRLPTRAKQTLRTPLWLIEEPSSFERLEKAAERGYDIEALVARDTV